MSPNQVTPPDAATKRSRPGDHSWVQDVRRRQRAGAVGGAGEFQDRSAYNRLGLLVLGSHHLERV